MTEHPRDPAPDPAPRRASESARPRSLWNAVAGLAVIGVAVLVWRLSDVGTPGSTGDMVAVEASGDAQRSYRVGSSAAEDSAASRDTAAAQASPFPQVEGDPADGVQLLRRHFPAQFDSAQFHRLWLVRDADGQVLLSGELKEGERLADAEKQMRGLQGQTAGPWQVQKLRNGAGQLVELAVASVELGEPRL